MASLFQGLLLVGIIGAGAACTTTYITTAPRADDGGTGETPDGGADGASGGGDACSRFVACTAAVAPETLDNANLAYGPSGACFATSDRETCLRACEQGIEAQRTIHPTEPACGGGTTKKPDPPGEEKDAGSCVAPDPCGAGRCGDVVDDCGRKVSCGGCSGSGTYCNEGYCSNITSTYDCYANGSGAACSKNTQYCFLYIAGPGGTYRSCKYSPAACHATPTCACLRANGAVTGTDTCSEGVGPNGVGAIYVSYKP